MNSNTSENIFVGDSEMALLMRSLDWSQTPLGPVSGWAQSLKTLIGILMSSRYPMFVWWGREYANLYNDAYRPMLGTSKHPQFLGKSAKDCWAGIWDVVGPLADNVLNTGQSTWSENLLLIMDRNGYAEEAYFTFSYSPVRDESGGVGGIFCAVIETTKQVIGERRLRSLRELSSSTVEAKTVEQACQLAIATLSANIHDIPFALLYLVEPDGDRARLVSTTTNIQPGTIASPGQVDLTQESDLWNLSRVNQTKETELVEDLTVRFGELPGGAWSESPHAGLVIPLTKSGQTQHLAGFLVVGVSPRRALDDEYRGFFDLVASHVTTAIANAQAYEAERKRAEALAELDRAKTLFFSNVSHEFRTPLTLMRNPLEDILANPSGPNPRDRQQLEIVYRNSQRLLKLVNTLLDFSRIQSGRIEAVYEPTDLAMLTADLAGVFRSAIERAGISLQVNCPPLPQPVYVDREMWEKIVLNLLSNAFKFTFAGEITVSLRWCDCENKINPVILSSSQVILEVRDTGTGIPSEDLPHIFERFHRAKGARGRSYEGSGIGLSLVQELVRLHGGTIEVSSAIDRGTCFTVSIPTGYAHLPSNRISATRTLTSTATGATHYVDEALHWLPEEAGEQGSRGAGERYQTDVSPLPLCSSAPLPSSARILLADDNADMRAYLKRLLSQQYEVETVADGVAALAAIRQQLPDLVLADVMMPELDGFELLRELRSNQQTKELPIVLLSARAGEESRIEGLKAGADDYLTKPFSARELLARVEATLKLAQLRREATQREQTLRQEAQTTKQTLETILSSISDGFYTLDRDWRYTYVNDRLCEIAGKQREELLGYNHWELFPDAVGTEVFVQFHRSVNEQTPLQFEYLYLPWNRWFEFRVYPSSNGLTIFVVEVTARKQAELVLVEQKKLLELIALGHPLDECLWALCTSLSKLNPRIRVCLLLTDAQGLTFPRSITPGFSASFGQGLKDAPINELCIGTCGEAVYSGQPVTCADIANDDRWSQEWRELCIAHGILGCHSAPVWGFDRHPLGSLMLCFDEARMPTDWEYQLAYFGTQVASIALECDRSSAKIQTLNQTLAHRVDELETLFDLLPVGVAIAEDPECRMIRSNRYLSRIVRVPVDANHSHSVPDDERPAYRVCQEGQELPVEELPMQYAAIHNTEVRDKVVDIVHPDGTVIKLLCYASPLHDAQGKVRGALGGFADITDRIRTEAALRQSEERYRYLVEATPQLVWAADAQGRNTYISQQMCDYIGLPSEQLLDLNWQTVIHPDDVERISRSWMESVQNGIPYEAEYRLRKSDGTYRWQLVRAMPLRDEQGQIRQWFGVLTDIHDKQELEEQRSHLLQQAQTAREEAERANRIKDEFLAVLSHELRSPLNPILGWSSLLQNRKLDEATTKQALATIERNAKLQSELIEDLLDVSRILRGKLSLTISPINLTSIVQSAIETVRLAAEAKSIEIKTKLDPSVGLVSGDLTRLQQVIWNLLSNAVKFTPPQGKVEVQLEQINDYAQITVSDTGKGIHPDFLPFVFDYFRQEDSATTRKFGGLGLGLAIVRHLVELHGGTVKADSPGDGSGANFMVRLPLMPSQPISNMDQLSEPSLNLQGIQILVVDDDTDTRDFVAFVLEEAGARVIAVSSAREAMTALTQSLCDVLLSDIGMPEMDGYMLMQQIRALPPERGGQIKAIALTAYAGDLNQQQALQAGFQRHLAKPIDPQALIKTISKLKDNS
ncbi:response regulator [Phormidium sp. LEGE 05292]|uniref:ATP-binding protein n=1 Tax=[Phormidium] sp. LEGE 05292 TaxID=767427 RepID=UPI00188054B0|nr:ATP-binding protein [Phormidium sp. LEGE 05292]MBE9226552.1 response regulator [Phormidium sp. LEGE 05292]